MFVLVGNYANKSILLKYLFKCCSNWLQIESSGWTMYCDASFISLTGPHRTHGHRWSVIYKSHFPHLLVWRVVVVWLWATDFSDLLLSLLLLSTWKITKRKLTIWQQERKVFFLGMFGFKLKGKYNSFIVKIYVNSYFHLYRYS